jgi:NAD(P)-dependent dehydrogenase (short-subunit alcohol dehydrogenase family)
MPGWRAIKNFKINMRKSKNQVVCITGASGGIGAAIVEAFDKQGAELVLICHRSDAAVRAMKKRYPRALFFVGDIGNPSFVKRVVRAATARKKKIDVLVHTAAMLGPVDLIFKTDPRAWGKTIQTNLVGSYLLMHEILPGMVKRKSGKIILFAGGGAAYSYPRFSAYGASKAALVRLAETVADEVAPDDVQVNIIAPGAVQTKLLEQVKRAGGEVRTTVSVDQPVALVLFLASRESDHITGRFIHSKDDYRLFKDLTTDAYKLRRMLK